MKQQVSDFELELMKIIWEHNGTALYAEITRTLKEKGFTVTKNTIISLLSRLVEKGYLTVNKIGRRNQYTAIVLAEQYQTMQTASLLNKVYEGNAKGLVATLIENNFINADDYEELKKYWEEGYKN